MNKFFLILIAVICFIGSVNAQDEGKKDNVFGQDKKHSCFLNLYPLVRAFTGNFGLGVGYEYHVVPNVAIGGFFQFYTRFDNLTYDIIINSKYYPVETKNGNPYINLGLGIRRNQRQIDEEYFYGLIVPLYFGWRFTFKNGLFVEPALGVRYNAASFSGANENHGFMFTQRASIGWRF